MILLRSVVALGLLLACMGSAQSVEAAKLRDQIEERILEKSGEKKLTMPNERRGYMKPQAPLDPEMVDAPGKLDSRKFPAGSRVLSNQSYGPDLKQKLDVYAPASPRSAPIILMVHGGAWRVGDKTNAPVVENKAIYWLNKGYIFVSINYRQSPQAHPLVQAGDVMSAIAWIQKNAPMWGGDPGKVILMGHSAGAHLVALVSANPEVRVKAGLRGWRGSILLDPVGLDMMALMKQQHYAFYDEIFGSSGEVWAASSPTHQLKTGLSPLLLICSSERKESCPQADKFAQKVQGLGGQAVVHSIALKHQDINTQLGLPGPYTDVVDKVMAVMLETPVPTVVTESEKSATSVPATKAQPEKPIAVQPSGIPEYQPVWPKQ